MTEDDERHGSVAGYTAGCRQSCCRAAAAARRKLNRNKAYLRRGPALRSALGIQRRINALQAMGWTQELIAHHGGWARSEDVDSMLGRKTVMHSTFERVDAVYRKLSMTPGPSARAAAHAKRQGWAVPLAWDDIDNDPAPIGMATGHESGPKVADELIVRAVIDGSRHPKGISVADRRAIVRALVSTGLNHSQIALRCGVSPDVVAKDLERAA